MLLMCTICTDLIKVDDHICATTCGHIYHHQCLTPWVSRSQNCPQCRKPVLEGNLFKLYPSSVGTPSARGGNRDSNHDTAVANTSKRNMPCEVYGGNTARDSSEGAFSTTELLFTLPEDHFAFEGYAVMQDRLQLLRGLFASIREELSVRNNDVVQQQAQLKSMEALATEQATFMERMKKNDRTKENELLKAKRRIRKLKQQLNSKTTELNVTGLSNLDLRNRLQQTEQDLRKERNELADTQRTVIDVRQQLEGSNNNITKLRECNRRLAQRLRDFTRAVLETIANRRVATSFVIYERQEYEALAAIEVLTQQLVDHYVKISLRDSYIAEIEHWHVQHAERRARNSRTLEENLTRENMSSVPWTWYSTDTNCYGSQLYYGELPVGKFSIDFYQSQEVIRDKSETDAAVLVDSVPAPTESESSTRTPLETIVNKTELNTPESVQKLLNTVPNTLEVIPTTSDVVHTKSKTSSGTPVVICFLDEEETTISEPGKISRDGIQSTVISVSTALQTMPNSLNAVPKALEKISKTFGAVLSTAEVMSSTSETVTTALERVPTILETVLTTPKVTPLTSEIVTTALETKPTTVESVLITPKVIPRSSETVTGDLEIVLTTQEEMLTTPKVTPLTSEIVSTGLETVSTTVESVLTTPKVISFTSETVTTDLEIVPKTVKSAQKTPRVIPSTSKRVTTALEKVPKTLETSPVNEKIPLVDEIVLRPKTRDGTRDDNKPVAFYVPKPKPRSVQIQSNVPEALNTIKTLLSETMTSTLEDVPSFPVPKPRFRAIEVQQIIPKATQSETILTTLETTPIVSKPRTPTLEIVPATPVPKPRVSSTQVQPTVPEI